MLNRNNLCILAILISFSGFANAEKADREQPIQISADSGTIDQAKGITIWRGNVVATQGTMKVSADEVSVSRDKTGKQTIIALGKPAKFRQKMDNSPDYIEGQGNRLDYNTASNLAILTGNAKVKRGGDLVVGNVITYNTASEIYEVKGGTASGPNKGRVTVILQPQTINKKK